MCVQCTLHVCVRECVRMCVCACMQWSVLCSVGCVMAGGGGGGGGGYVCMYVSTCMPVYLMYFVYLFVCLCTLHIVSHELFLLFLCREIYHSQ